MRFVRVPFAEAEGCILGHTLRAGAITFARGRRLIADDLRILAEHGAAELEVARLEAGDIDQGTAAAHIAEGLCGAGLRASEPVQGRCRVIAEAAGVLRLTPERITALNEVDEAIMVSSLAAHDAVAAGEAVATVRVLPFAISEETLRACLRRLDGPPLIDLAEFRAFRASLLLVRHPATTQARLTHWSSLIAECLANVGGVLAESRVLSLDEGALRDRLRDADPAADIVLVAGPASTIHRSDPLPTAIGALGGRIIRLGVPTDPGSQLLWAGLDGRPVVGLPACHQLSQLRGFEPLLRRFAAGLEVSASTIAALGVGGLHRTRHLDDDEDLPLPAGHPPRVAAVILASGRFRRHGDATRLLAPVDGQPLIRRAVDAALASKARPVIVVLAAEDAEIVGDALLGLEDVQVVHAGPTLTTVGELAGIGLAAVPAAIDAAVFQPGDMPYLRGEDIDMLIDAYDPIGGAAICLPSFHGRRGSPTLYDRRFFSEIAAAPDGLNQALSSHGALLREVDTDHPGVLMDLDTLETLSAWSATA